MRLQKILLQALVIILLFIVASFVTPKQVSAHCDTLDGPVVNAARKALETDNVNYMLIWVKPENEDEIRRALKKAKKKIKQAKSKEEKEKANMELFEILVKVHREGEGAEYDGIKPAGSVEAEIALADKAVEIGKLDDVMHHIHSLENKEIVHHLFHKVQEKSHYDINDVSGGRRFIEAYVIFIHAVERAIRGEVLHKNNLHNH
jgi:YesN/AraC family two-component response regulator